MAEPPGDDVLVVPPMPAGDRAADRAGGRRPAGPDHQARVRRLHRGRRRAPDPARAPPRRLVGALSPPPCGSAAPGGGLSPSPGGVRKGAQGFQRPPAARRYEVNAPLQPQPEQATDDDETAGGRCRACTTHVDRRHASRPHRPRGPGPARGAGTAPGARRRPDPHAGPGRRPARSHRDRDGCGGPHVTSGRPRAGRPSGQPARRKPAGPADQRSTARKPAPRRRTSARPAKTGARWSTRLGVVAMSTLLLPAAAVLALPGSADGGSAGGGHDATALALHRADHAAPAGRPLPATGAGGHPAAGRAAEGPRRRGDRPRPGRRPAAGRRGRPPPTSTGPCPPTAFRCSD